MTKIICYELNEVPWRVVDFYVEKRPQSTLKQLLTKSTQITTYTRDSGKLHPWSTWPTMHRGIPNDYHNIRFINQDLSCASQYPPIWERIIIQGKTVGIFGSLQSGGAIKHPNVLFHIPDTFYINDETIPSKYQPFQTFNLMQTSRNRATAEKLKLKDYIQALNIFRLGLTISSVNRLITHLYQEKINSLNKSLRPMMQAVLAFDVFKNCLQEYQPDYVTFFTNHVAGIMHRYWKYTFPQDFNYKLSGSKFDQFHQNSILKAMDIADQNLQFLVEFAANNDYDLVIASSMGQEAIERGEYIPEIKLDNVEKLVKRLLFDRPVKLNMAMQPDFTFEFTNKEDLQLFLSQITSITDTLGNSLFQQTYPPQNLTLSIFAKRSSQLCLDGQLIFNNQNYSIKDFGLTLFSRDIGTGYHQPNGIIIWHGKSAPKIPPRTKVDSCTFLPTILEALDLKAINTNLDSLYSDFALNPR